MPIRATIAHLLQHAVYTLKELVASRKTTFAQAPLIASRFVTKMLYGVAPTDPATYIAVSALLTSIALVAMVVPARRAARVDPAVTLRSD